MRCRITDETDAQSGQEPYLPRIMPTRAPHAAHTRQTSGVATDTRPVMPEHAIESDLRISVVVPAYNSEATIHMVLEALLRQSPPLDEIVVADSSDRPAAKQMLAEFAARGVKIVDLPTRTPPAAARNAGAAAANGDWLVFVDSDAPPQPDWSEQLHEAIATGPRAGGGALAVHATQQESMLAWAQYFLQFNEFTPAGKAGPVAFTPSANLFCERQAFTEVGGFPNLRAAEDVAFGHAVRTRLQQEFWFHPGLVVDHIFRTDCAAVARNQQMLGSYVYVWRNARAARFPLRGWRAKVLWPLLVIAKGTRMAGRVFALGDLRLIARLARCSPWFVWGLWHWGLGFARGPGVAEADANRAYSAANEGPAAGPDSGR